MNRTTKNELSTTTVWIGYTLLVLVILALVGWTWMFFTAEIRGRANAEVQLESASNRITSYEHFFDLCAAIQGYEAAIVTQNQLITVTEGEARNRAMANSAGITSQRYRAIAQYNADAAKAYTKARFLGDTLPHRLDPKQENTQCN